MVFLKSRSAALTCTASVPFLAAVVLVVSLLPLRAAGQWWSHWDAPEQPWQNEEFTRHAAEKRNRYFIMSAQVVAAVPWCMRYGLPYSDQQRQGGPTYGWRTSSIPVGAHVQFGWGLNDSRQRASNVWAYYRGEHRFLDERPVAPYFVLDHRDQSFLFGLAYRRYEGELTDPERRRIGDLGIDEYAVTFRYRPPSLEEESMIWDSFPKWTRGVRTDLGLSVGYAYPHLSGSDTTVSVSGVSSQGVLFLCLSGGPQLLLLEHILVSLSLELAVPVVNSPVEVTAYGANDEIRYPVFTTHAISLSLGYRL